MSAGGMRERSLGDQGRFAFIALLLLVALSPFPLGSNRDWVVLLEIVVIFGMVATVIARRPEVVRIVTARVRFLLFVWLLFLALHLLQVVPMPTAWFSGSLLPRVDLRTMLSLPDAPAIVPLSYDVRATLEAYLETLFYGAVVFLSFLSFGPMKRRVRLLDALILSGVLLTLVGLLQRENGFLSGAPVSGGFVNPNHYALYMVIALIAWQTRLLLSIRVSGIAESLLRKPAFWVPCLVLLIGLSLSTSRGAFIAFLGGTALMGLLAIGLNGAGARLRGVSKPALAVLLVVLAVLLLIAAPIMKKMVSRGVDEGRVAIWKGSIEMLSGHPVFGVGGGAYAVAFPPYKTPDLKYTTPVHAHNDYLEVGAEYGATGGLVVLLGLAGIAVALSRGMRQRNDGPGAAFVAGSAAVLFAIAVHAAVDFPMQIPAIAIAAATILGAALRVATRPASADSRGKHRGVRGELGR